MDESRPVRLTAVHLSQHWLLFIHHTSVCPLGMPCIGHSFLPKLLPDVGLPDSKRFPHYSGDDMYTLQVTRAGYDAYLLGDLSAVLYGPVHPKLNVRDYFRDGLSPAQILRSIFVDKKSPYRIATQFFAMTERHGPLKGAALFLAKQASVFLQYCRFQISLWLNPSTFKVHT